MIFISEGAGHMQREERVGGELLVELGVRFPIQ